MECKECLWGLLFCIESITPVHIYAHRIWGDPVYVTKTYDDVDYVEIPPLAHTESIVLDSFALPI